MLFRSREASWTRGLELGPEGGRGLERRSTSVAAPLVFGGAGGGRGVTAGPGERWRFLGTGCCWVEGSVAQQKGLGEWLL